MNDLRRFTLRYRVMLQARCSKKFPVIFTGKSPESDSAQDTKKKKCHQTFRSSGTGNFGETFFSAYTLVFTGLRVYQEMKKQNQYDFQSENTNLYFFFSFTLTPCLRL
jgi:hypothetical protein